ncbi:MAG: glycosyltransferase [Rhodobacterales bacterium]
MTLKPTISLVIVSRDRPEGLARLLMSLRFQTYYRFEVVVVSNSKNPALDRVRHISFDQENISAARNLGIQAASGDLIAFCDDDAVPEPTWLENLVAPFHNADVGMAVGYVRGRNGIGFQWTAQETDQYGRDRPLVMDDASAAQNFTLKDDRCPKVQGTNCMFRKSLLSDLGGFDENFAFYLDETDVCRRASLQGWATAIVPLAEVQHGFEESGRRTAARVPKSLFQEGKSKAYFCKKHGRECKNAIKSFQQEQHNRLIKLMVLGHISPGDVKALFETLQAGLVAGQKCDIGTSSRLTTSNNDNFTPFLKIEPGNFAGEVVAGSVLSKATLVKAAIKAAKNGIATTLFCWSFTALFHRRYFDPRGFWVQVGGLFGKSDRRDGYFQFTTVLDRSKKEANRIWEIRRIKKISFFRFKKCVWVVK